jgi:maleate cis-trans isomerase
VRLGVLVPAGNPTIEPELYRMAPRGVTIHFARLDTLAGEPGGVDGMERRTLAYLDSLPAATCSLAAVKPDTVVLAHTAVSYLTGFANEPELLARLRALAGASAFTAAGAIHAALRHLRVRRLALATPYPETIGAAGRAYWEAAGFEIVAHRRLDTPNIYDETEDRAHDLGRAADTATAEALLISGTGLPTAGILDRLEKTLQKPVVTSQAATLWHALQVLRISEAVKGYGRLLSDVDAQPR